MSMVRKVSSVVIGRVSILPRLFSTIPPNQNPTTDSQNENENLKLEGKLASRVRTKVEEAPGDSRYHVTHFPGGRRLIIMEDLDKKEVEAKSKANQGLIKRLQKSMLENIVLPDEISVMKLMFGDHFPKIEYKLFNQFQIDFGNKKPEFPKSSTVTMTKMDGFHVFLPVSGFKNKLDLSVTVSDNKLLVKGETQSESGKKTVNETVDLPDNLFYDPELVWADIIEGGELKVVFPYGKDAPEKPCFTVTWAA